MGLLLTIQLFAADEECTRTAEIILEVCGCIVMHEQAPRF